MNILVEHNPSPMKLEVLGVDDWPLCDEPVAISHKVYAHTETTYIIQGTAEITPQEDNAEAVIVGPGDLITLLPGTRCTWNITEPLRRRWDDG